MDGGTKNAGPAEVTLSVVSHGDGEKIRRLLQSLRACEPEGKFRILLTDNLGNDLEDLTGAEATDFEIIRNERPEGFARNQNQAFKHSNSKCFCILNPDVVLEEEVFQRLTGWLEAGIADIVSTLIVDSSGVPQDSFRKLPTPLELIRRRLPGYRFVPILPGPDGLLRPDWMAGMFLLMSSETFRQLGGFDERFRMYFEDVDLCTRAKEAGLKLVVDPNVRVVHDAQRASRSSFKYLLWHLQSAVRFYNSKVYRRALKRRDS